MESMLSKLVSGKLSTYAAIILMFTYSILLDRDFACTCQPQAFDCFLYLSLPVFIILLLMLWTDRSFQRICRYLCTDVFRCCGWVGLGFFLYHIVKAALVGLLWVAFVFIDGDWYICCMNDHSEEQEPLACKGIEKITEKEHATIAELKNRSRCIGGWLLFGIVLGGFLLQFFVRTKCCGKSRCCQGKVLYEKVILGQQDKVLKEILRTSAKNTLTKKIKNKIRSERWEECFDVAGEMIKLSIKPTISDDERPNQYGPGEAGDEVEMTHPWAEMEIGEDTNQRNEGSDGSQSEDQLSDSAM